jgi:hypothetical protein
MLFAAAQESAYGTKRTFNRRAAMSAFGSKADIGRTGVLLSFGLDARLACQLRPFWNLGGNIGCKLSRTVTDDLGALLV